MNTLIKTILILAVLHSANAAVAPTAPIEQTPEYKACFTAIKALYAPRGISEDAMYEFCTDADNERLTVNPSWRVDIKGER